MVIYEVNLSFLPIELCRSSSVTHLSPAPIQLTGTLSSERFFCPSLAGLNDNCLLSTSLRPNGLVRFRLSGRKGVLPCGRRELWDLRKRVEESGGKGYNKKSDVRLVFVFFYLFPTFTAAALILGSLSWSRLVTVFPEAT